MLDFLQGKEQGTLEQWPAFADADYANVIEVVCPRLVVQRLS